MSPKKVVLIVCILLIVMTIIFGAIVTAPTAISEDYYEQYYAFNNDMQANKNYGSRRTVVSQIIEDIKEKIEELTDGEEGGAPDSENVPNNPNGPTPTPTPDNPLPSPPPATNWIENCKFCHRVYGCSGLSYARGGSGVTCYGESVRRDCSGYVSYCLYKFGRTSSTTVCTSGGNWAAVSGVVQIDVSQIQPGDIAVYNGHVQIWMGPGVTYNNGSNSSCYSKYTGYYGTDPLTCPVDPTAHTTRGYPLRAYRVQ